MAGGKLDVIGKIAWRGAVVRLCDCQGIGFSDPHGEANCRAVQVDIFPRCNSPFVYYFFVLQTLLQIYVIHLHKLCFVIQ